MKIPELNKQDYFTTGSFLLLWTISILIADTSGSFPLNDDWSYARSVKTLLDTGKLELTGWTSMPLVTQVCWGYLWCLIFGFSFDILRISTQFLSFAGLVFLYLTAKNVTSGKIIAVLVLIISAFNPLYFLLSSSFMTDVPFFSLFVISLYFFIKYLRDAKISSLTAAFIACLLSVFIRHTGIVIIFAFAVSYLFNRNANRVKKIIPFVLTGIILILFFIFNDLLNNQTGSPLLNNTRTMKLISNLNFSNLFGVIPLFKNSFFALIYIGLFIFPYLLFNYEAILSYLTKNKRKFLLLSLTILPLVALLLLLLEGKILPSRPNTFYHYGLGPALLRDVDILELKNINYLPSFSWTLMTYLGLTGSLTIVLVLSTAVYRAIKRKIFNDNLLIFLFCLTLFSLAVTALTDFYDRYLIIFPPLFIMLLFRITGTGEKRGSTLLRSISYALIFIMILFTVLSTHDYFAWNRARWNAIDHLTNESKVPVNKIDGGFEFNGWNNYDPAYIPSPGKSWWWVDDDEYIISFGGINGYKSIRSYGYYSWLYLSDEQIHILKEK